MSEGGQDFPEKIQNVSIVNIVLKLSNLQMAGPFLARLLLLDELESSTIEQKQ